MMTCAMKVSAFSRHLNRGSLYPLNFPDILTLNEAHPSEIKNFGSRWLVFFSFDCPPEQPLDVSEKIRPQVDSSGNTPLEDAPPPFDLIME